ncbi:MAG TPA: cyclase family protein [Vicinamibacterales bacterium]|jgi:kynurenine formamidase
MRSIPLRRWFAIVGVAIALAALGAVARGQTNWYPSKWGAADQRGAANRITPAKVLEARDLIKTGKLYQLGHVYEAGMPIYGTRHYSIRIPQAFPMPGKNQAVYHDEIISGELGQIGTQFDGLGHLGIGDLFYNGNKRSEFAKAEGLTKLGVENVGAIVTRGVLIDVAKYKGVAQLAGNYEITPADIKGALQREGAGIKPGDMVLFHTGWGSLWMKDNTKFGATEPGIGIAAGQMLVDAQVVVVGADTWGVEIMPNPDPTLSAPVHQLFLAKNGIYLHENLITEELARDNAYEFMYSYAPLRLKGATGSPGNPIAIR